MTELLLNYRKIYKAFLMAVKGSDAALVRVPSVLGFKCLNIISRKKLPYALEVVANPYDIAKQTKSLKSWLLMRVFHHRQLKACRNADGVAYVTKHSLQSRYPASKPGRFESTYSSVDLTDSFFGSIRKYPNETPFVICHVSQTINTCGKGHLTVIKVVKQLADRGYHVTAKFAGEGKFVDRFNKSAEKLGIQKRIEFVGSLDRHRLSKFLTSSHLMVFPTKSEGLPRVIIEGLATGLPCLSTPVGGIPEILPEELLFQPDDVTGFADKIAEIIDNPNLYEALSSQSIEIAGNFTPEILQKARIEFYNGLLKTIASQRS